MKNTEKHTEHNDNSLNAKQVSEMENDPLWTLLDSVEKTTPVETNPMFARNVMREIRLSEADPAAQSVWQRIFSPQFSLSKILLTAGATAACAAFAFTMISEPNPAALPITASSDSLDTSSDELSIAEDSDLEAFANEIREIARQDPFYISEEEIEIAMQM